MICVYEKMQHLIIIVTKGTETPNNYVFGSVRYQNAPCCALNKFMQMSVLEYENLKS